MQITKNIFVLVAGGVQLHRGVMPPWETLKVHGCFYFQCRAMLHILDIITNIVPPLYQSSTLCMHPCDLNNTWNTIADTWCAKLTSILGCWLDGHFP